MPPSYLALPLLLHLLLLPALSAALQLGVEWSSWPEPLCNVLPLAVSGAWTARDGSLAPTSPSGWPTSDAYAVLFDYAPSPYDPAAFVPSIWGTFQVSWQGQGDVALYPGLGRVLNSTFDAPSFTTTAYVALEQNENTTATPGLVVGVFNSVARAGAPPNSGFTDLRVVQPGCVGAASAPFFTPASIAAVAPFAHARVHEWSGTNTIPVVYPATVAWGERRALGDVFWAPGSGGKPKAVGAPWEAALLLAAQAAPISLWVNIPVYADDEYVAALADLLRHGSAGIAGLEALQTPWIYLEHGNELWLNQSNSPLNYAYNFNASVAEVARGASPLNNDGCTVPEAWARRRHAKRLREISLQFASAFAGSTVRVRPVLAWMQDYAADAEDMLAWLEATYGAGEAARVFHALAVNSYRGGGVYPSSAPPLPPFSTPADVLASLLSASDASLPARLASAALAQRFGLSLAVYEGSGWVQPSSADFNGPGFNATLGSIIAFNRLQGAAEQQAYDLQITWHAGGLAGNLSLYNFYALSGQYGSAYGACLGLCEDITQPLRSPKYAGALALLAEAREAERASLGEGGARE
jgi:hypothetical protein